MLRVRITFKAIVEILTEMTATTVNKFIDLDFQKHSHKKTGEIISTIERLQESLPQFLDGIFVQILPITFQIITVTCIIYQSFGIFYSLVLTIVIIIYLILAILHANKTIYYQTVTNQKQNEFSEYLLDTLMHYDAIKYFSNEVYEKQQIKQILNNRNCAQTIMYKHLSTIGLLQVAIVSLSLICVTVKSGYDVVNNHMSLGGFVMLNSYILQFSLPLSYFGFIIQTVKRSLVNIKEFLNLTNTIHDQINDITKNGSITKTNMETSIWPITTTPIIEFRDVCYGYPHNQGLLYNLSFKIKYGEQIAILGKTGAGKSTIIKLMLHIIEPTSGMIFIDNQNILDISNQQLIKLFSIVPQDCALFNRTIYDNIKYGNQDATPQEIMHLMHILKIDHLNPDLLLGERSAKISGGEKQRIAIARALLKKSPIYVFDEFTSSLDLETENIILQIMNTLLKNKTRIIITHKMNTAKNSDQVIELR